MFQKFENNSAERQMFVDYWTLCQKYWLPEDTNDAYWHEVVEEIYKFTGKYREIGLAGKLAQALITDLEERR